MGIVSFLFGERDEYTRVIKANGWNRLAALAGGEIRWKDYLDEKFDLVKADLDRPWYSRHGGFLDRRRVRRIEDLHDELSLAHLMCEDNRLPDMKVSELRSLLVLEKAAAEVFDRDCEVLLLKM